MEKFIEIPVNGKSCIVNVSAIQCVQPLDKGCSIHFLDGNLKGIRTEMPYEELRSLIFGK